MAGPRVTAQPTNQMVSVMISLLCRGLNWRVLCRVMYDSCYVPITDTRQLRCAAARYALKSDLVLYAGGGDNNSEHRPLSSGALSRYSRGDISLMSANENKGGTGGTTKPSPNRSRASE